jgi:hypothetical protein
MGMMELDSVHKELTILLRIRNGHLLPLIAGTRTRNENTFSLTAPVRQELYLAYDIHLNIVGLRLNIESLPITVNYLDRGHELVMKFCFWQPPDIIQTRGWALGFIPLWLINALIPSNIEEITANFFRTLALGNHGAGTHIDFESRGARQKKSHLHLQAGAEVLGNGTIKMAFNMQRKMVAKQDALLKEFEAFDKQFTDAFFQDYQRVKAAGGCQ